MSLRTNIGDIRAKKLAGSLGAEIMGIDLSEPLDSKQVSFLEKLLLEHLVLFFPGQNLSESEHVGLGRNFGSLEAHPHLKNPTENVHPEIFELAASHGGVADEWHTDITFQENPAIMSILHMVKCPNVGGDTMWSSMYAAYEALSKPMQEFCSDLTALHDASPHGQEEKMAIHPVIRVHPMTGRKALYVNEHFTRRIVELSHSESEVILGYLTRWASMPQFTVRYSWTEGDIAIWDNRCTQHFVLNDFEGDRLIQRVTVMGDEPKGESGNEKWEPWLAKQGTGRRYDKNLRKFLGIKRNSRFN